MAGWLAAFGLVGSMFNTINEFRDAQDTVQNLRQDRIIGSLWYCLPLPELFHILYNPKAR